MTKKQANLLFWSSVGVCLVLTLFFEFFTLSVLSTPKRNFFLTKIFSLGFGWAAIALLLKRRGTGLFQKPTKILFLLPALIIAADNFPFASYFAGKMQRTDKETLDLLLFAAYCLFTGLFEETVFRGLLFTVLAERFEQNKNGLTKTVFVSSLVFGAAHLLNMFYGNIGGALLQAGYSCLTGLAFAYTLIKTKNLFCCALAHGLYNFCGLFFSAEQGLGAGVVFDLPTAVTMLVVSLAVAAFAIFDYCKYTEEERRSLYERLL